MMCNIITFYRIIWAQPDDKRHLYIISRQNINPFYSLFDDWLEIKAIICNMNISYTILTFKIRCSIYYNIPIMKQFTDIYDNKDKIQTDT